MGKAFREQLGRMGPCGFSCGRAADRMAVVDPGPPQELAPVCGDCASFYSLQTAVTDPRRFAGSIVGPSGPQRHNALVDARDAVLAAEVVVCQVETAAGGALVALQLSGRVNHSTDQARVLFLLDEDGTAKVLSELLTLVDRMGADTWDRIFANVRTATSPVPSPDTPAADSTDPEATQP